MPVCAECNEPFQQTKGGRPRKFCYKCRPFRAQPDWRKYQKGQPTSRPRPKAKPDVEVSSLFNSLQPAHASSPSEAANRCIICKEPNDLPTPWCSEKCRTEVAAKVARAQASRGIRKLSGPEPGKIRKGAKPDNEKHAGIQVSTELADYVISKLEI